MPSLIGRRGLRMLARFLSLTLKAMVASLIVGAILSQFGITAEQLMREAGLTPERLLELVRQALAWALPNVLLGSFIILPVWFAFYIFRPPRHRSE